MRVCAAICFVTLPILVMGHREHDEAKLFVIPFPSTWYQKTLDTMMLIWEDVRLFNSARSGLDYQTWHDLLVGRLVRLKGYCKKLVQDHTLCSVLSEEYDYLVTTINTIMQEYRGKDKTVQLLLVYIRDCIATIKQ